ncbi:partial two-component system, NarL family, sensor histidine kinase EvgS, partial [Gammaproteobacteria bacterium]
QHTFGQAATLGKPYEIEHRIIREDNGEIRFVKAYGEAVCDESGRPVKIYGATQDITERKRVEAALSESEERFRTIAHVAPVPLVVARLGDDSFQYVNPLAAELVGLSQAEMIGRKAADFYAEPQLRAGIVEAVRQAGVLKNVEMRLKRADGTCFWGLFSAALARLDNEEVIISSVKDITKRKQAEEALRDSEERFRALVTASSQIVWRCDPQGNFLDVSAGWMELTGQTKAEFQHGGWVGAIHPEDRFKAEQTRRQAFLAGKPFQTECRVRAKDGGYRWLRGICVPIFNPEDGIKEWVGAYGDVSEYKLIGNALRDSEARLRTLTASVPAMLWSASPDGVVNYASQAYYDFTGLPPESLESGEWVNMIHPEDRDWVIATWQLALQTGYAPSVEYRVLRADGTYRWFKGEAEPAYDEEGRISKWFGSIVDIDELKQLEAELMERDRQKDEFLAMLAHELQTPLAPVLIAAQLLEARGKEDAELFDWAVGAIRHESQHLSRLVNELLDVARVTQGKIILKRTPFDLREMVERVVETNRLLIGEGRQQITCRVPAAPVIVEADQARIGQVLGNLLGNALKYTPADGSISVILGFEGNAAVLRVRDSGVGIPKTHLGQVFGLFSQIESTLDRANGGLGVGLALAKRLIEKHGGSIEAHSEGAGRGSEFVVRLPLPSQAPLAMESPAKEAAIAARARKRVLVVDDNEAVRTAVAWLIETLGYEALEAEDGRQALDMARSQPLDIVLLDIGLPGMDGYEVARRLRREPGLAGLKLVAVTGYSQERDRQASLAAGFDHHLAKPLDHDLLEAILAG